MMPLANVWSGCTARPCSAPATETQRSGRCSRRCPPSSLPRGLGRPQREALGRILAHPEVSCRTPVGLVHHPPMDSRFALEQLRSGLTDAPALRDVLGTVARGLVLFGHCTFERAPRW